MTKNNKIRRKQIAKKIIRPFPCKDCIALPVCKGIRESIENHYEFLATLTSKCKIINNYIGRPEDHETRYGWNERKLYQHFTKVRRRESVIVEFFNAKYENTSWVRKIK